MRSRRLLPGIGTSLFILLFSACAAPGLLQAATATPSQPPPSPSPALKRLAAVASAAPTFTATPIATSTLQPEPTSTGQAQTRAQAELQLQALMPQPGDAALSREVISVDRPIVTASIDPAPVALITLKGWLPTPCDHLRIQLAGPDSVNLVTIQAYAVVDPQSICAQVLTRFVVTLPVSVVDNGSYTLEINGEIHRGFDWPLR